MGTTPKRNEETLQAFVELTKRITSKRTQIREVLERWMEGAETGLLPSGRQARLEMWELLPFLAEANRLGMTRQPQVKYAFHLRAGTDECDGYVFLQISVRQAGNPTPQLWSLSKMRFRYTLMEKFAQGIGGDKFWDAENQCKEDIFWDEMENQIIGIGAVQAFGPGWDEKHWTENGDTVTTTIRNADGQFVGVLFCRSTIRKTKNGYTLVFWIDKALMTTHHEVVFCRHSWLDTKGQLDKETASSPPHDLCYTIKAEALPDSEELRSYLQAGMITVQIATFSSKYASVEHQELKRLQKQLASKEEALVKAEIQINFLSGNYDDLDVDDEETMHKLGAALGNDLHKVIKVKKEYKDHLPNQRQVRRFYNRKDIQLILGLIILVNFIVSLVEAEVGDNYQGAYAVEVERLSAWNCFSKKGGTGFLDSCRVFCSFLSSQYF